MENYYLIDGTVDQRAVSNRIDELTSIAKARMDQSSSWFVSAVGGAGIKFLNASEKDELHELKLLLPSYAQLRMEASRRLSDPNRVRGLKAALNKNAGQA